MDLFSAEYILFLLPVKVVVYRLLPGKWRRHWLGLISLLFLSSFGFSSTAVALLVSQITFRTAIGIAGAGGSRQKKGWVLTGILSIIGMLLLSRVLEENPGLVYWQSVGLSYYGLMCIAYLADVYSERVDVEVSYPKMVLYTVYFPHLVAGPISRPADLLPQFHNLTLPSRKTLAIALKQILYGLFCKLVVADRMGTLVDPVLDHDGSVDFWPYVLASFGYSIQIYFDFAGYSFLVVGISRLFGLSIINNFNRPYLATTTKEFWKRWHISLTEWLRRYLYLPLGGSRDRRLFPLTIILVFCVSGLWHGFEGRYLVWAMMHAACYLLEHYLGLTRVFSKMFSARGFLYLRWILFLSWLNLTWAVFRSDRLIEALNPVGGTGFVWHAFNPGSIAPLGNWIAVALIALVVDHAGISEKVIIGERTNNKALLQEIVFLDIWLVSLFLLGGIGSKQVLYFNF